METIVLYDELISFHGVVRVFYEGYWCYKYNAYLIPLILGAYAVIKAPNEEKQTNKQTNNYIIKSCK